METGLSVRLSALQGDKSTAEFARKCGIGESLVRKYLDGSTPGPDKAIKIALATGTNIQWLATGEGPMRPDGNNGINDGYGDYTATLHQVTAALDKAQLASAIETVEEALTATRRTLAPTARAELIAAAYDLFTSGESGLAAKGLILLLLKTTS